MSEPKQLTGKQLDVIAKLANGTDVDELMKEHNITAKTFYKWLTGEAFARQMRLRRQVARCQSELLLGDSVYKAAEKLVTLSQSDDKPDVARRACLDILTLVDNNLPPLYEPTPPTRIPLDRETAGRMLDLLSGTTEPETE